MLFPENMVITEIMSRGIHYKKSKSIRVEPRHVHTLSFRVSGEKLLRPDGAARAFVSGENSITFMPHGLAYEETTTADGYMLAAHFSLLSDTPAEAFILHPASPIGYRNLFEELVGSYRVGAERDYRSMALLYELFAMCRHESDRAARHAVPRRIRTALTRINSEFADPELSVAALSEEAGVSEVYFRREFKRCAGMPPREYIRHVRLENAKALLATALYSVSETATRCGFDSISYFSAEFRRAYGVTPSEFVRAGR